MTLESNPEDRRLDVKKRFTEEQIIGFLREAESGLPVAELCRRHGFSEASYYLWRNKFGGGRERLGRKTAQGARALKMHVSSGCWPSPCWRTR